MKYNVIGLMSGTSMDGLDLAYCQFEIVNDVWVYDMKIAETIPYSKYWLKRLNDARRLNEYDLQILDKDYGNYLGHQVLGFVKRKNISNIDYVSSHGHTVHHRPKEGVTIQVGNGDEISQVTKNPVIYDFRIQDVKLGGQGAPLVPIGDQLLFPEYDACLNLGGFANISFTKNEERKAFDICPVNIVLNNLSQKLGFPYDADGEIARNGKIDHTLLKKLNDLEYYQLTMPKSLGIEWVESEIFPMIHERLDFPDMMRTFVAHIANQISITVKQNNIKNLLITGGGVFNTYLIECLSDTVEAKVVLPSDLTINFKEALIFAFLGVLRVRNEVNVLKSVTGATKNHCSGKMAYPVLIKQC